MSYFAIEQLTKTEAKFESIISDKVLGLNSTISQTADKIILKVENIQKGLEGTITQTAESLRSEYKDADKKLEGTITQTAESLRTEYKDIEKGLDGKITSSARTSTSNSITLVSIFKLNLGIEVDTVSPILKYILSKYRR